MNVPVSSVRIALPPRLKRDDLTKVRVYEEKRILLLELVFTFPFELRIPPRFPPNLNNWDTALLQPFDFSILDFYVFLHKFVPIIIRSDTLLKLTYPYEEVDPLNPPPPASESKPDDEIEVENPIEHEDKTVPVSVYEDMISLFGRMVNFSRRLCGRETTHALVEKKGEAKDKFYGKLILDLGNEVHSSMEQGTAAMKKGFVFEERPNEAIDILIEDEKSPLSEPRGSPPDVEEFNDGMFLQCWFNHHTTNGHQFTMFNRHQELASPKQTTLGNCYFEHYRGRLQAISATINGHEKLITEDSLRRDLKLDDAEGISSLSNEEIFEHLAHMGYVTKSESLTFFKAMVKKKELILLMVKAADLEISMHGDYYGKFVTDPKR
ncbi:hypothetical protein Tco_1112282 [Tanacetum coccineum]|uniref:Uncharacterized protein n=1 Tax=Tanacetum coccineum TaxID=301880 RepID=A0ABQ5IP58_9ASTR